jgi:hypothetical protein
MTIFGGCPIARPFEWPTILRRAWVRAATAGARARTVSHLFLVFTPFGGSIWVLFVGIPITDEARDRVSGVPESATAGVAVLPRRVTSTPTSLYLFHQRRGRGTWKGGDDE